MRERNKQYERDFIEEVVRQAGVRGYQEFIESTMERLSKGAKEYGENAFFDKHLAPEVMEECMDIAGWSSLWAEQLTQLEREGKLDLDTGLYIKTLIIQACTHAVQAYLITKQAADLANDYTLAPSKT